jgi:calcineurin-like phosphoesterase family protein
MDKNWRALVKPGDTVLHLGDLAIWYGRTEVFWLGVVSLLPGQKYMLRGNHDKLKDHQYKRLGYTIIPEFTQVIDGTIIKFSHDAAREELPHVDWDLNIHGHVHNHAHTWEKEYINVSVEVMRYRPVRLRDILSPHKEQVVSNVLH